MKKLYPIILGITLILVSTACSRGSNVFKGQALILRKTTEHFVEYDDAGEEV